MTFTRTISTIILAAAVSIPLSSPAAAQDPLAGQRAADAGAIRVAQASAPRPSMGMGAASTMPGYAEQMQAMQQMHDKMQAAKTPEERQALMAEQMKLMHDAMSTMHQMGPAMRPGTAGHRGGPGGALEQRMDMMQSMMQMMMDRMQYAPPAK